MVPRILLVVSLCFLLSTNSQTQTNQKAFSRETKFSVFYTDGTRAVKAYRLVNVVYDDQGKEVEILLFQKGDSDKLDKPCSYSPRPGCRRLRPEKGEFWVQREGGYKNHRATVEVKEVTDTVFDLRVTKGAPEILHPSWPRGSTVAVYSQGFSPEQQKAIERALLAWNVGLVTFEYKGEGEGQLTIKRKSLAGILPASASAYSEIVATDEVNSVITGSTIWIDPRVTKLDALTSIVAHELGHQVAGFSDCKDCKSVMKVFRGIGKSNGYFGPSLLDLEVLKKTRSDLKALCSRN